MEGAFKTHRDDNVALIGLAAVWVALSLPLGALCAAAVRESPSPRHPGERLHLSLQNEVDAAVGRADLWLKARQRSDGSWGGSNRVATAYAVLALQLTGAGDAAARGRAWLKQTAAAGTNTFWTALATGAAFEPAPRSSGFSAEKPYALDLAGFSCFSGAQAFLLAEINRAIPSGLVVTPRGWRERLASQTVARQLTAPDVPGGGHWSAAEPGDEGDAEAQTALALLILLQL